MAVVQFQTEGFWLGFEDVCDMTVNIGSQKFNCQRCVLCNRCGFFRKLYRSADKPRHMYVDLNEFPGGASTFQTILDYCYGKKIEVSADKGFLYLNHAASFLEMKKPPLSDKNNLEDLCDVFWDEHILNSWRTILDFIVFLKDEDLLLPKCKIDIYLQKCIQAFGSAANMRMNCRDLAEFIQKLVMLPEDQFLLIFCFRLDAEWPKCTREDAVISFALTCQMLKTHGTTATNALGSLAKHLLQGRLQRKDEKDAKNAPWGAQNFLALRDAQPITYILVLLDVFFQMRAIKEEMLMEEEVMNARRKYFHILSPEDLGTSCPDAGLQLIRNLLQMDSCKSTEAKSRSFILRYLQHCRKSCHFMEFKVFLAFAKTLSGILKHSHNALYDEIVSYSRDVTLSEEARQSLGALIDCAKLSKSRLQHVIESDFPSSLKHVVLFLKKENVHLRTRLKRRRSSAGYRLCYSDDDLEGACSSEEEPTDVNMASISMKKEVSPLQTKETGSAKRMKDLSNNFYISVITLDHMSLSFPIQISDTVSAVEQKIDLEMERNSLRITTPWHLNYKGKEVSNDSSFHGYEVEKYDTLHMQKS